MKTSVLLTTFLSATRTTDGFSTTSHNRSNKKIVGPLSLPSIGNSMELNIPNKLGHHASPFHRRTYGSFHMMENSSKSSVLFMSKLPVSSLFLKPLYKSELPPTIRSNLSISIQWIIFALSIAGISFGFHIASLHEWLDIDFSTWDKAMIFFPSFIASSCIYHLAQYTIMQGSSGGGEAIATMMGGTIINEDSSSSQSYYESGDLKEVLLEVYAASGLPMQDDEGATLVPNLYLIPDDEPNAFAAGGFFGSKGQIIALTTGLLDKLNLAEVRAVIAHEVGHLRNQDTTKALQLACMIAALGSIINIAMRMMERNAMLSSDSSDEDESDNGSFALELILFAAGAISFSLVNLLRLASSRSVEYDADSFAKSIGVGDNLVSALEKISNDDNVKCERDSNGLGVVSGAWAHSYISNPPSKESPIINMSGLLRTHPTTIQRIQRLQTEE